MLLGIFKEGYWDAVVEYAKESPNSMAVKMSITNRGRNPASIHVIPTFWYVISNVQAHQLSEFSSLVTCYN